MTLEVRIRPEAEQDLADAAAWYEEQRQGRGHEFLDEILAMLSSMQRATQGWRVVAEVVEQKPPAHALENRVQLVLIVKG